MAYKNLYSEQQLEYLSSLIESGDKSAEATLRKEVKRVVKAANQRLLRLERAGYEDVSNAYERASYYTDYTFGSNRFKVNKSLSADDLIEEYREVRTFLRKESSTVKGIRYAQDRLIESLNTYNIKIPRDKRDAFFRFVNSDNVQDAIEFIGEYDVVMDAIANNIDKLVGNYNHLMKQFEAFLKGDIFYDELLERISGENVETLYQRSRKRGINYDRRR